MDKTSPFRVDEPQGFRKALALARKLSEEAQPGRTSGEDESWDRWVEKFVDDRYRGSCRTLTRYLGAWEQWRTFLELKRIGIPRALGYQEVLGFVEWRSAQVKKSSGKRVSRTVKLPRFDGHGDGRKNDHPNDDKEFRRRNAPPQV